MILFSESQSRIIVTVAPQDKEQFEKIFENQDCSLIGTVSEDKKFIVKGLENTEIINISVDTLETSYKEILKDY